MLISLVEKIKLPFQAEGLEEEVSLKFTLGPEYELNQMEMLNMLLAAVSWD